MRKRLTMIAAWGLFAVPALAQQGIPDSAAIAGQQQELKETLRAVDGKMAARQQAWLDAQKMKVKYDTIGLWKYRYDWAQLKNERKLLEIAFVRKHPGYLSSLDALKDVIGPLPDDIVACKRLFDSLDKPVRENENGKKLKKIIDGYMQVRVGAEAPLFTSSDTAGQQVQLKGFRGKYLLLDFWASWCGPCREENPVVVDTYRRFKDKNFDILSVSLDQPGQKAAWIKAIQQDHLSWTNVSDLKYWQGEAARLYSVVSIPQNFLIDPSGKIVAKNLRGEQLIEKLEELFKQ